MRCFVAAILLASLTLPAYAQAPGLSGAGGVGRGGTAPKAPAADPEKKKAEEKAFNDAVKRIPLPDKKFDPWGNVRDAPKH